MSKGGGYAQGGRKKSKRPKTYYPDARVVQAEMVEAVPVAFGGTTRRTYYPQPQRVVAYQPAGQAQYNRLKEHKTFDGTAAPVAVQNGFSNAGTVAGTPFAVVNGSSAFCLNQVPLGNSSITRVGRRFANTAIALRGRIIAGSTGTVCAATMVLVWDRNPNQGAAIPPFTSVFSTQAPESLTNKDNAPRFKILRRWVHMIIGNNTAGQLTDCSEVYFDEFVKLKNKITLLTAADTTGLITDMVEGSLLLYIMGDTAPGTTSASLVLQTRLYFSDN